MNQRLGKLYRRVSDLLPPDVAGRVELLRTSYSASWGGPLNGQERRQEIVRSLARAIRFEHIIETGTYRGTSTEFFAAVFGVPIDTVEASPRYYAYSRRRLARQPHVTVSLGDSRDQLRRFAGGVHRHATPTFFYLDAHWAGDLPLVDELRIIAAAWSNAVIMIDDFKVPDDAGYSYDEYGPTATLVESYLPKDALAGWVLSYPSAASTEETGAKRGCCVLASPDLAASSVIEELRVAKTF